MEEILLYVVCGCCALLCVLVVYLCVIVRRIRRDLQDLSRNGNLIYTEPIDNRRDKTNKEDYNRKRESSSATRYVIEPGKGKPSNRHSSVHQDPGESVTYLTRPGEVTPATARASQRAPQIAGPSVQVHIPLVEFVNEGFVQDSAHNPRDSNSDSSSECDHQPIYSNDEAIQDQENNNPIDEPLYQNRGELSILNNPERPRLQTMDIKDI
ncbi:hypothetical protein OS493_006577 [Desmophyllum pertusum]|uniref:Uncharacterized protein n=1 Tax=Desmophyllum pertusum TaxID=174260 RepID=A0A9X0A555_9CNID|nr:hypothetical protein OS493_006577 [Desmophyllum pertusum]